MYSRNCILTGVIFIFLVILQNEYEIAVSAVLYCSLARGDCHSLR